MHLCHSFSIGKEVHHGSLLEIGQFLRPHVDRPNMSRPRCSLVVGHNSPRNCLFVHPPGMGYPAIPSNIQQYVMIDDQLFMVKLGPVYCWIYHSQAPCDVEPVGSNLAARFGVFDACGFPVHLHLGHPCEASKKPDAVRYQVL